MHSVARGATRRLRAKKTSTKGQHVARREFASRSVQNPSTTPKSVPLHKCMFASCSRSTDPVFSTSFFFDPCSRSPLYLHRILDLSLAATLYLITRHRFHLAKFALMRRIFSAVIQPGAIGVGPSLVTADKAVEIIKSGDRVFVHSIAAAPQQLIAVRPSFFFPVFAFSYNFALISPSQLGKIHCTALTYRYNVFLIGYVSSCRFPTRR